MNYKFATRKVARRQYNRNGVNMIKPFLLFLIFTIITIIFFLIIKELGITLLVIEIASIIMCYIHFIVNTNDDSIVETKKEMLSCIIPYGFLFVWFKRKYELLED
jgi:multisubunit Na+/H+ antiporter MnhB subunit